MTNDERQPTPTQRSIPNADASRRDREFAGQADPADEVPVPIAMSPAEIDERAQAVDAVREGSRDALDPDSDRAGDSDGRLEP
ncbi:MAG TPA: hypothetical protein VGN65_07565 [Casimicrobiaceae bacterium]|jgi:hypothetical protein